MMGSEGNERPGGIGVKMSFKACGGGALGTGVRCHVLYQVRGVGILLRGFDGVDCYVK